MRTRLRENPECQDSAGGFDRNRFARLLQLSNLSEQAYLARLGVDIKRQQLVGAVTEAAVAPASLAERLFVYREERSVADYVSLPTDSFTVSGEPDGQALQELSDAAGDALMPPAFKQLAPVVLRLDHAAEAHTHSG